MNALVTSLKESVNNLSVELEKGFNADGSIKNKAAVKRARKITSELTKQGKEFRAESVKAEKGL